MLSFEIVELNFKWALKVKTKELYIFALNLQKSLETYADRKTNKKYLLTHQSEQFMR